MEISCLKEFYFFSLISICLYFVILFNYLPLTPFPLVPTCTFISKVLGCDPFLIKKYSVCVFQSIVSWEFETSWELGIEYSLRRTTFLPSWNLCSRPSNPMDTSKYRARQAWWLRIIVGQYMEKGGQEFFSRDVVFEPINKSTWGKPPGERTDKVQNRQCRKQFKILSK